MRNVDPTKMNTSYEAWAKFDEDDALARVDLLEQQEQIARQKQHKIVEKRRVEETISKDAEQSAEVLAAHAAVAALKAKARSRCAKRAPVELEAALKDSGGVSQQPVRGIEPSHDGAVAELSHLARLMQQKHALIRDTMSARGRGDAMLEQEGECDWIVAKNAYESALASVKTLEALVPQLLEQQHKIDTTSAAVGNQHHHDKEHDDADHHHTKGCHGHNRDHDHDHSNCSSHSSQAKKPVVETLPQKDDLGAVVKMFLKDCYMGIGACEMGRRHYAAASEAFKEVLLRDENHLLAWLKRGRAFEALGAPLLAWLHYNRVTNSDPMFEDAAECEERIKGALVANAVKPPSAPAATSDATLRNLLSQIKLRMDAGNVIMIEGFFEYAKTNYEAAIDVLSNVRAQHSLSTSQEALITKLETTCHVNIASCFLEMQKQYPIALKHCQLALENDPGHIIANFRLAQVNRAMHAYEQALESYHTVRMLLGYLPPAEAIRQLEKLDEEMDKCQFDRGQYDTPFIRQQMQKEQST